MFMLRLITTGRHSTDGLITRAVPVAYAWGWNVNPRYGYYGYYFNPYPVYPSAAFWLTDYLVAQSLAASYQAQADAVAAAQANAGAPPDAAPLTPEVKNLISAEVARQVAIEKLERRPSNRPSGCRVHGLQRMMTDNIQHVFVVGRAWMWWTPMAPNAP